MRYIVFVDELATLPIIAGLPHSADQIVVVTLRNSSIAKQSKLPIKFIEITEPNYIEICKLNIKATDHIVISIYDFEIQEKLVEIISALDEQPPILVMTEGASHHHHDNKPNVAAIDIVELTKKHLEGEWKLIEVRRKAYLMRTELEDADKLLIMIQDDPDPDAIASAMAIQAIMGKDDSSAHICSFGTITRGENIAMTRLLNVYIATITQDDVKKYDHVVMVDTQPPHFTGGFNRKVDVVIDHHPLSSEYEVNYADVNVSYGSTSTMMYEYLKATDTTISKRLATALLYGIITDTMYLARDTSRSDFDAFSELWPLSNIGQLSSISRPRLSPEELSYFVRAIKGRIVEDDLVFIWLGQIKKEDIIPRLADFSLQIGKPVWSAVAGEFRDNISISIRYMGMEKDAGMLAADLFSLWGSAGGHHSMAKAVIPVKAFKKALGIHTGAELKKKLFTMFRDALSGG